MNQKQKYLGLLAMLPLLTIALTSDGTREAVAENGPTVKMSGITQKGDNSYWVSFTIHVGGEPLPDGKLLVTSDSDSTEALYRGASVGSITGTDKILVIAQDPSSIHAKIISEKKSDFKVRSKLSTLGTSWVELTGINQKGDMEYELDFTIHVGGEPLPDGRLLVTSDSDSTEALYRGASVGSITGTSNIRIQIDDPASLRVSMQDLEPEVDPLPVTRNTR
ncbi:MAG TPA: hypothetical protein VD731_06495 [Nitrosopumilaceae archaeon]|nr:hypothetical protein [Nitrosopumilaceae archaeon]